MKWRERGGGGGEGAGERGEGKGGLVELVNEREESERERD